MNNYLAIHHQFHSRCWKVYMHQICVIKFDMYTGHSIVRYNYIAECQYCFFLFTLILGVYSSST